MRAHQIMILSLLGMVAAVSVQAAGNAVRQGSSVSFFCTVAEGSANVNVAGRPMARVGDAISCASGVTCPDEVTPITGTIGNGSSSVRVNGVPAAVSGVSVVSDSCNPDPLSIGGWPFVDVAP